MAPPLPDRVVTDLGSTRWPFHWHPEVWLLVAFLIGAYVYMVRVIGPRAVPAGTAARSAASNLVCFGGAMAGAVGGLRLAGARHQRGVPVLGAHGAAHGAQLLPAAAGADGDTDLAGPRAARRRAVLPGRAMVHPSGRGRACCSTPMVMIVHIPLLVNASVESGPLHYGLHVLVVTIVAADVDAGVRSDPRVPDRRSSGTMIYLFLKSVVPTIPAAWLTFAEDVVYQVVRPPDPAVGHQRRRGSAARRGDHEGRRRVFLWAIVIFLFFRRFADAGTPTPTTTGRARRCPTPRSSATTRCRSPPPTSSASSPRTDAPEPHCRRSESASRPHESRYA